MFSISIFTLVTILLSVFFSRAQVNPSEPSPGSVYPEGGSCPIVWGGDPKSVDTWKNMDIELMTGDNFDMIHVTSELYSLLDETSCSNSHSCRYWSRWYC